MASVVRSPPTAPVPPQNLDAEESVLGAMMLSPGAIGAVSEVLDAGDFYRESHAKVYRAALSLYARGEPVDAITLVDEVEERGELEDVGGRDRIHELASLVPATANAGHYAKIVREMATLRGLIRAGSEVARLGWERPGEAADLVDQAEQIVFELSQSRISTEFSHIEALLKESFERITALYEKGEEITGAPSGFRDLDRLTGGFQPGNLVVVASRPSMGKSALGLGIAANLGVRHQTPVALFTLEMSKSEVTQRLMCSEAKVESQRLRTGKLAVDDWPRLTAACDKLAKAPIYVDDTGSITMMEIRAKARRLKMQEPNLGLIIVDYLQLMTSGASVENRVQEVSQISRQLKVLARDLDVPVLAMSQLSRAVEQRHDKRPILSDLRESGCLTGESRVFLPASGRYVPIRDMIGREGEYVLALNEETWRLEPRRILRAFSTGVKPVYRLTTRLGRTIRATGNHKFRVFAGWRRLDELEPGSHLAVPRRLYSYGSVQPTMSDAELALLGHLIGRSHQKRVPTRVFEQPPSSIATFLRHLWATDGCLHASRGNHYPVVRYDSSSRQLTTDVQSLLLRLGINAKVYCVDMKQKGRPIYRLDVQGREDIVRFLSVVGAVGDRRRRQRGAILDWLDQRRANTNRDVIPREAWRSIVQPAMAEAGVTTRTLQARIKTAYCGSSLYRAGLSRERALVVAEAVGSDRLADLALSDVYWDRIVSIEPEAEEETFDLTVEGEHNFVAEDLAVHNSIEQDADLVFFIYRDEYYNEETDQQGLAEVILGKHRNGPTGIEKLSFLRRYAKFADLAA
ncbi:MAG TPA: replicative DNA helicase [Gaiellaceae bacterium]|nr:replicative DNA helicase [Gaiellaceae bacterium]